MFPGHRSTTALMLALMLQGFIQNAQALTDLADVPLASSSSTQVKPNILFILDDSGSMNWTYMPDGVGSSAIGYRNHQCNTVFYNPATSYEIPKDSAGVDLNSGSQTSFTSAWDEGFHDYMSGAGTSRTNLGTSFSANGSESGRAAYYWTLAATDLGTPVPDTGICNYSTGSVTSSTTGICCSGPSISSGTCSNATYPTNSPPTCSGGRTLVWEKTLVSSTSGISGGDERQNFANWYSYYRSRIQMMKSSAGRALAPLTDSYRVGFITIHPGTVNDAGGANGSSVSSSKFLKIADFDTTQRSSWYSKLYSQKGDSGTPLRTALSIAGRYFTGKNDSINKGMVPNQADDPVQYSCQQNFAILTTDGYWNDGNGRKINGSTLMDNQDGALAELDAYNSGTSRFPVSPRPIYDGGSANYVWNTASNAYQYTSCSLTRPQAKTRQLQKRTVQNQRRTANFSKCRPGPSNCQAINFDCTVSGTGDSYRSVCRVTSDSGWNNIGTCTAGYSDPTTTLCRVSSDTGFVNSGTCTASNPGSSPTVTCRTADVTSWAFVDSCTPSGPDVNGTSVVCQTGTDSNGKKIQNQTTTTATRYEGPDQSGSIVGSPTITQGIWTDLTGVCYAAGSVPALPADDAITGGGPPTPPSGCSAWPCETTSTSGGSSNTLADVAQHYYKTDLRTSALGNCTGALGTGVTVCDNNVPHSGLDTDNEADRANWQHMTTFTMGLGLSGTLNYRSDYKTADSGDFKDIKGGTKNWPIPKADDPTALDDLWHAAVNGRGQYFSARDPDSVVNALSSALSGINARVASAAAAATSNLEPVAGDNFAYTAQFVTQKWIGELTAREIDLNTGAISGTSIWSAQAKLEAKAKAACDNRTIKLFRSGAADNLADFTWDTYACDASGNPAGTASTGLDAAEQANFGASQIALLSQYPSMTDGTSGTVNQRSAAAGANLVNYLRGQGGKTPFEANDLNKLFRAREKIMGDIVNSQPVFVKAPSASYNDSGYSTFKSDHASRTPIVFAATNDGMLHAFHAGTSIVDSQGGDEAWAFIPTMVLPNLYKLASENYASQHIYLVDGTPVSGDVFDTTVAGCASDPIHPENCWKTILVAGLNKGGKGYYALDITDPAHPKGLWEFKWSGTCYDSASSGTWYADCHLGYTYNNPVIGKLADGRWVVIVTSGYNNVNSPAVSGDGQGYLYVLEATTGKILYKIGTGVGSAASPSGLNHVSASVTGNNAMKNNQIDRVYGVDLLGNLWRFDINDTFGTAGREASLLAQAVDETGTPQSITTRPRLSTVNNDIFVYVGTGRYLGSTDGSTTQTQTVWAIKDAGATVTNLRATLNPIHITQTGSGTSATRSISNDSSQCSSPNGWYADLPDTGERVNIDMQIVLGSLLVGSNIPTNNACTIGGYSWLTYFNTASGCGAGGILIKDREGSQAQVVGLAVVRLPTGKIAVLATMSTGAVVTIDVPVDIPPSSGKRVSWREIIE